MNLKTTIGLLLGAAAVALPASAQVVDLYTETGTAVNANQGAGNYGVEFTPNQNISVTQLGAFDFGSFSSGSATINIWKSGDLSPVATASVSLAGGDATPATWDYVFVSITPVTLTSGVSYVLQWQGNTGSGSQPLNGSGPRTQNTTYLSLDHEFKHVGSGFSANPYTDPSSFSLYTGSTVFLAANMEIGPAAVPEPSTYAAISGLGLLGFAALRRFRR